jgi:hypothetical protein
MVVACWLLAGPTVALGARPGGPCVSEGTAAPSHFVSQRVEGQGSATGLLHGLDALIWDFGDSLAIRFKIVGSCSPDVRFAVATWIRSDTLVVCVADTATDLGRCSVDYELAVTIGPLPGDHYVLQLAESRGYTHMFGGRSGPQPDAGMWLQRGVSGVFEGHGRVTKLP